MKKNLAIFRAGTTSLHGSATADLADRSFDYGLSWFGKVPADEVKMADGAVFVDEQTGAKWPGLAKTLVAQWDIIGQYEYVWLPDDDLLCAPQLVDEMFAICADLRLDLAQPALTRDSFFSHAISLQHPLFQIRFTNFVEVMAPVFSRTMLSRIVPTLQNDNVISGWGLDSVWPNMSQLGKVAIIDSTPVKHMRPIGGPNYAASAAAGLPAGEEAVRTLARYGFDAPADVHLNYGGLLASGDAICIDESDDSIEMMLRVLSSSLEGVPLSARAHASYLGNHVNYWRDGARRARDHFGRQPYPRNALRDVLTEALQHVGIAFA